MSAAAIASSKSGSMSLKLAVYRLSWTIFLPLIVLYLLLRSLKDKRYRYFIPERFGFYNITANATIWIHANSLGEVRSAAAFLKAYLDRGEALVVTNMTPAGRSMTKALFADQVATGQLMIVYVPFEFKWVYRRFFNAFRPKVGLVMEAEIWPQMIMSSKQAKIPLFLCNAQYSMRNKRKSKGRFLANICREYGGIIAKSNTQAERFRNIGCQNITVCGETRFDQDIPASQIHAAKALRPLLGGRAVVTVASVVADEAALYQQTYQALIAKADAQQRPRPFFVHVTRAPERFLTDYKTLTAAGLTVLRRSQVLDDTLAPLPNVDWQSADVLVGDSLGEMNFFQSLADVVSVSGSFSPQGSHNICEPIALGKPVINGPVIWPIEYPAVEAIDEGALYLVQTPEELTEAIDALLTNPDELRNRQQAAQAFLAKYSGAVDKTLAVIDAVLKNDGAT